MFTKFVGATTYGPLVGNSSLLLTIYLACSQTSGLFVQCLNFCFAFSSHSQKLGLLYLQGRGSRGGRGFYFSLSIWATRSDKPSSALGRMSFRTLGNLYSFMHPRSLTMVLLSLCVSGDLASSIGFLFIMSCHSIVIVQQHYC